MLAQWMMIRFVKLEIDRTVTHRLGSGTNSRLDVLHDSILKNFLRRLFVLGLTLWAYCQDFVKLTLTLIYDNISSARPEPRRIRLDEVW